MDKTDENELGRIRASQVVQHRQRKLWQLLHTNAL